MKLNSREREVISLAKKGLTCKSIATRLNIEYSVAQDIIQGIFEKLEVKSLLKAVRAVDRMEDNSSIEDIAQQEWNEFIPVDSKMKYTSEYNKIYAYWLIAWKLAKKRFKD